VEAPEDTGLKVFDIAEKLLQESTVELCHPELIRERGRAEPFPSNGTSKKTSVSGNVVDAHANVESAWALSDGTGATIALIDDGVDIDHQSSNQPARFLRLGT